MQNSYTTLTETNITFPKIGENSKVEMLLERAKYHVECSLYKRCTCEKTNLIELRKIKNGNQTM